MSKRPSHKERQAKLKRDRKISRDNRNSLRRQVINATLKSLYTIIFADNETENMEKILFSITPLNKEDYLVDLPQITTEKLNEYYKAYIRENNIDQALITEEEVKETKYLTMQHMILAIYGIYAREIAILEEEKIIIVKNFRVVDNKENLLDLIVRPYNGITWYGDNSVTTIGGKGVYKGKGLKPIFRIRQFMENFVITQDTIADLAYYKEHQGKVEGAVFGSFKKPKAGCGCYGNKHELVKYDPDLYEILKHEQFERPILEAPTPNSQNPFKVKRRAK